MQGPQTWRELLGKILQDPHERARIAAEVDVNPVTLARWAHNETNPRPQLLQALLRALPQYRESLLALMSKEFGPFLEEVGIKEDELREIPAPFYARILHALVELPVELPGLIQS